MKMRRLLREFIFSTASLFCLLLSVHIINAATNDKPTALNPLEVTRLPSLQRNTQAPQITTIDTGVLLDFDRIVPEDKNPYSNVKNDLTLYYDEDGGYIAEVYTPNGFLDAVYDPAALAYNPNSPNTNPNWSPKDWKNHISELQLGSWSTNLPGGSFSNIHKIILAKDINMDDIDASNNPYSINLPSGGSKGTGIVNGTSNYRYVHVRHNKLDIDGNQHYINMMNLNIALCGTRNRSPEENDISYKEDWTVENTTVYSTTYWGYLSANTGLASNYEDPKLRESGLNGGYTWFTYKNMNFVGSQFAWTGQKTTGVSIEDNVNVNTCYSYTVPNDNHIWRAQGGGNQQNFEVDRVIFKSGCHYTGYSFNGVNMELTGKATFEDDSIVDLYPHGTGPEHQAQGMSFGIYMPGSGNQDSVIEMNGNSKLNIHCDSDDPNPIQNKTMPNVPDAAEENHPQYQFPCGAIDMESSKAQLVFNKVKDKPSPQINIDSHGQIFNNKALVYFSSGDAELANGTFNMKAYDLGKYDTSSGSNGGGLMNVGTGMLINVRHGGNFNLEVANDNHSANHPLNLLYAQGKIHVNIVNPANVTLNLNKDPCNASALVYADGRNSNVITLPNDMTMGSYTIPKDTNIVIPKGINSLLSSDSNSDIEVYNSKIRAYGNNSPTTENDGVNGVKIAGPKGSSEDVYIGADKDGGPVRVEKLELPFTKNLIDPLLYADGTKIVQAPDSTSLKPLKDAMFKMLGKEFRYINLSDLPGPNIKLEDDSKNIYPNRKDPTTKISGVSGGDEWQDYNGFTLPNSPFCSDKLHKEFLPSIPLIRVQVKRPKTGVTQPKNDIDYDYFDLGTEVNTDTAEQKANSNVKVPTLSELVNPVTPNILDDELGNMKLLDANGKNPNPNLGKAIQKYPSVGDEKNPNKTIDGFEKLIPKYLPIDNGSNGGVIWDNGSWNYDLNGTGAYLGYKHKLSYKLNLLLDNYNKNHPSTPIYLRSTDQILTSVTTNFQSSPSLVTYIRNLSLSVLNDEKKFLIGDDIKMPLEYYDGDEHDLDPNNAHLIVTGNIDDNNETITAQLPLDINHANQNAWKIKTAQSTDVGSHKLSFTAKDNANPPNFAYDNSKNTETTNNNGDTFTWHYSVLNLPSYVGNTKITDNPYESKAQLLNGDHKLVTTFTPKADAPVHSILINHDSQQDTTNWTDMGSDKITAYYTDAVTNEKITVTRNLDNANLNKVYDPTYFGWNNMRDFPANTTFIVKRNINVNSGRNDSIAIGGDIITSQDAQGNKVNLGISNTLKYNISGSITLEVPDNIDYGSYPITRSGEIHIKKISKSLKIINDTSDSQSVQLIAAISSDNPTDDFLSKHLYYKDEDGNHALNNYKVYENTSLAPNVPNGYSISDKWGVRSNQKSGPIIDLSTSPNILGKHKSQVTWTLTFGPN
ncbi:hypothetical protein DS832_05740 [Bombilactobacillus bombi]|uniref:WxL domain-containing protein n=1 Tax=Bombilactobacillus bombi TaxID=1303590 RepID=A0A417Z7A8_9LACO|nr:hypothetical protein [Bombilactobacillus bombi]RHW46500.1 hypothetical protein DS832_05740 [Bombilactobacillus bombi]